MLDGDIERLYVYTTSTLSRASGYGQTIPAALPWMRMLCQLEASTDMMLDKNCTLSARYFAMKAVTSGSAAGSFQADCSIWQRQSCHSAALANWLCTAAGSWTITDNCTRLESVCCCPASSEPARSAMRASVRTATLLACVMQMKAIHS